MSILLAIVPIIVSLGKLHNHHVWNGRVSLHSRRSILSSFRRALVIPHRHDWDLATVGILLVTQRVIDKKIQ